MSSENGATSAPDDKLTDDNPEIKCDICGKPSKNKFTLTQHKKIHLEQKPFTCQYCNKGDGAFLCFACRAILPPHFIFSKKKGCISFLG